MENQLKDDVSLKPQSSFNMNDSFTNKNMLIGILIFLLVLSFLGINLLSILGNVFEHTTNIFGPLIANILSFFGYTTGSIINKTADVVGDGAKTGIDIAQGTIHNVGDLLKNASQGNIDTKSKSSLDNAINLGNTPSPNQPNPTPSENPIQKSISSNKSSWCLVGEFQEKRGCIEIGKDDKCLSGQVFPTQKMCLNPTLTPNV